MPGELSEAPPDKDDDNITDWCLGEFRSAYCDETITKDNIWEYLYGVVHAPDWRERYRNDQQKNLPRVPVAEDFEAFQAAGHEMMDLHASYETCPEYENITVELADPAPGKTGSDMEPLTASQAIKRAREDYGAAFLIADRMRWNRVRNRSTGKLIVERRSCISTRDTGLRVSLLRLIFIRCRAGRRWIGLLPACAARKTKIRHC